MRETQTVYYDLKYNNNIVHNKNDLFNKIQFV